ncbi:MAG: hypothetical protein IJ396_05850 [Oscillibacter sp.]|nr:hypothetical protein [Oscillibacter sp.]
MAEKAPLAQFTIRIESAEHATWQGTVETDHSSFHFESEMQLLHWLMSQYPDLRPKSHEELLDEERP